MRQVYQCRFNGFRFSSQGFGPRQSVQTVREIKKSAYHRAEATVRMRVSNRVKDSDFKLIHYPMDSQISCGVMPVYNSGDLNSSELINHQRLTKETRSHSNS
jgi:hypothetical protein